MSVDVPVQQQAVPASAAAPVDWAYLDQAALGDRALADEVLDLFADQVRETRDVLQGSPETLARPLHKLKGAARAIGAWPIAAATQAVEARLADGADPHAALAVLRAEIAAVLVVIAARPRGV